MGLYEILKLAALLLGSTGAIVALCFIFAAWLDSRETHIEPIVSEGARK